MAFRILSAVCLFLAATAGAQSMPPNIGAAPPGAPAGCNSPYAALLSQPNAQIYGAALQASGLGDVLRRRNATGTYFVPTDQAFMRLATNMNLNYGEVADSILESIVLYHTLQQTVPPSTFNRLTTTPLPYKSFLVLDQNNMVPATRTQMTPLGLLVPNPMSTYQNLTLQNQGMGANPDMQYVVNGANSMANVYQQAPYLAVETCSGYIYRLDNVLLPGVPLTALATSAPASA